MGRDCIASTENRRGNDGRQLQSGGFGGGGESGNIWPKQSWEKEAYNVAQTKVASIELKQPS